MTQIERLLVVLAACGTIIATVIIWLQKPGRLFHHWYRQGYPPGGVFQHEKTDTEEDARRERERFQEWKAAYKRRVWRHRISKGLEALFVLACIGTVIFLFMVYWPDSN